jgi:L,D-peptidoglycan transpeptidase YkuD (ErfK/YbiS/YcfS/YnhG family)
MRLGRHWRLHVASIVAAIVVTSCSNARTGTVAISTTTTSSTVAAPTLIPAPAVTTATTAVRPVATTAAPRPYTAARPVTTTTKKPPATTTVTAKSTACPSTLASQVTSTGGGNQLITVVAASAGSTSATVTLWQRTAACWSQAAGPWTGRVGFAGLSAHHREGDGTTPTGLFGISSAFYGIAPDPGVHGSYHQLVCGDWWDEDPASPHYNSFQHVACGTTPLFGGKSEALWTNTVGYQSFAVVSYNAGPVIAGAGSAIFVHVEDGKPTNGCISLPPGDLDSLLRWLQPAQSPHIAIATSSTIGQF